jgi:N-acyl-D-amino-acid deacylase
VLKTGAFADIVVFDPNTVAPGPSRRVRDFPADAERLTADQPVGMHHLFVNGQSVIVDGALTAAALTDRPGRLVSSTPR